jgi:hypothetical protein
MVLEARPAPSGGSLHAGLSHADWLQGPTSAAYGRPPPISPPPPVYRRGPRFTIALP